MRRPQFTLKTLLWSMTVVAAFCAGTAVHQHIAGESGIHVTFYGFESIAWPSVFVLLSAIDLALAIWLIARLLIDRELL